MNEQHYKILGWFCFLVSLVVALLWSYNHSGLAGVLLNISDQIFKTQLVQITWVITFAAVCLPGWWLKNYFEAKAWDVHVKNLPPPDIRDSAKRSKYVKVDHLPPPPSKPVVLDSLPEGQQEFVATCPACGNLFSANRTQKDLKCPNCGEAVPLAT
ncbi:MAG: hypothetical protein C5B54_07095 [Acidobacteria bacterium]|nr:MAG: hypothetical protein C5B54_07095 [Acidobacteriota bacterium]